MLSFSEFRRVFQNLCVGHFLGDPTHCASLSMFCGMPLISICAKKKTLTPSQQEQIKKALEALQNEILAGNRQRAFECAEQLEVLSGAILKKSPFEQLRDLVVALSVALIVAICVRQMWFEFYEIPTGSMRPTLKEKDRLVVSKTDFGINIPLALSHFYFDPSLVKRSGTLIFTGENMDIRDVDTMYFYIFPGKKQFVKRLIGKPGDTLYFYGGLIYGIDKDGRDISPELQIPTLSKIDHIPFDFDFDRKISATPSSISGIYSPVIIYQMNEPVARLFLTPQNQVHGEILNPPQIHNQDFPIAQEYGDLWGFKNYATARLLTRDQVRQLTDVDSTQLEEAPLYLELRHNPSIHSAKLGRDEMGRLRPMLGISTSVIPLNQEHLHTLFNNLYTARFIVKNGIAYRYGQDPKIAGKSPYLPHLPGIPNGCYEFYYGKAYEVKWEGITFELPSTHPLYRFDPARLQLLFNIGIEFDMRYAPQVKNQHLVPARYAYFRDKNLYVMGAPLFDKGDPILLNYIIREEALRNASNTQSPYVPFLDNGPPLHSDGSLNSDFIKQYGIVVPHDMYLALGDNHAMSADSRDFGFVPQQNLRGGPEFIFWPPGSRWGAPNQPPYPFFNIPRTIVWIGVAIGGAIWFTISRRRNRLPLKL